MEWSSDLVNKIESEGRDVASSLATLNPSDSLPLVKLHSERKLLALTPRALDVLDEGMSAGLTKDRVAAASKVLDLSPATRIQTTFGSEQSIPVEALKVIFESMAKMFNARSSFRPSPVADPIRTVKEEADEAPAEPDRTIGRPDAAPARRIALRPDDGVHGDGLPSQEGLPESSAEAARRPKQLKAQHRKGALKR
jgi:hypothetical protein